MEYLKNLFIFFFLFLFFNIGSLKATDLEVNAYFFYGDTCPHCAQERLFINQELKKDYQNLKVYEYEIYNNFNNVEILQKVAKKLNVSVDGVPFLVIGDRHFIGYANGMTSSAISRRVAECSQSVCPDSIAEVVGIEKNEKQGEDFEVKPEIMQIPAQDQNQEKVVSEKNGYSDKNINDETDLNKIITLPLIGKVNIMKFSLPVLAVIIGALDGFNPCALWTLLFLISLLLGMENRKRMWLLGITFIISSASVYFLFMSAWLNLILFLGFIIWIRLIIGFFAFAGGVFSVREFFVNKDGGCKVAGDEKRRKIFEKLKLITHQKSLIFSLMGIIALAFAVNLVELICSAGLPAVYTQILAMNSLATWQYYSLIVLYIFFFMVDDLFVFLFAMITLEMTGMTTKYARFSRLLGGIILLLVGLMLIFKPGWLMFN